MKKTRSLSELLASGKGDRFRSSGFNLFDDAEKVLGDKPEEPKGDPASGPPADLALVKAEESAVAEPCSHLDESTGHKDDRSVHEDVPRKNNEAETLHNERNSLKEVDPVGRYMTTPEPRIKQSTHQKPTINPSTHQKPITKPITKPIKNPSAVIGLREELPSTKPINPAQNPSINPSSTHQKPIKRPFSLFAVTGMRKAILFFLYRTAKNQADRTTDPIVLVSISDMLGASKRTVEVAVARMIKEGWFSVHDSKRGRGGWVIYKLSEHVFLEIFKAEAAGCLPGITHQKPINNPSQNPSQNPSDPSSSSSCISYYSKEKGATTNTSEAELGTHVSHAPDASGQEGIPDEWRLSNFDCSGLYQYNIKFGQSQINQIRRWGMVTPEELRQSIEAFAFNLSVNKIKKFHTLNAFMGILKRGPYAPPENFVSEEERMLLENAKRMEEALARKRDARERLEEAEFQVWLDSRTEDEIRAKLPSSMSGFAIDSHAVISTLRAMRRQVMRAMAESDALRQVSVSPEGS